MEKIKYAIYSEETGRIFFVILASSKIDALYSAPWGYSASEYGTDALGPFMKSYEVIYRAKKFEA